MSRAWKQRLEWLGVDPGGVAHSSRPARVDPTPEVETHEAKPGEYHSSEQEHLLEAVDAFLVRYRRLYPPLPPEEARRPVGTRQKPTPFRLEKRDVTAKNVQVGTVLEVPGNLDYTKFKKRAEGNLAVRVTDEPEVVDGNVIIPTTAGAYIVPLKHYVVRLRMYENS